MSASGSFQGFPDDTSPDARRVQFAALRRLTPAQRIALVDDLTKLARDLAIAGLRQRHPEASESRIEELFFEMTLGPDLAHRVSSAHRAEGQAVSVTLPSEFVMAIASLLESLAIPYHVGGSIASSTYGTYRMTADVDFVIDVDGPGLVRLAEALKDDFYVSPSAMIEALAHRSTFNAIHLDSSFKIDFFVRGARPYDIEEFGRRVPQALGEQHRPVMMKSPEDTVLRKLEWFRAGGEVSEQQWRDVVAVLKAMGTRLDAQYLERWAAELGVSDLLERASMQGRGE